MKTVLMIADQMLERIQTFHNQGFIHRDVKPDNFVFGIGEKSNLLYLIDYGLSRKYLVSRTGTHIEFRGGLDLIGTARYVSINTHLGIQPSRRDDIESIAYVLIYLLNGQLPWQGIAAENKKKKYEAIAQMKLTITPEVLCQGLPEEFLKFLNYSRKIDFPEQPDYDLYRRMFRELYIREGYADDNVYDWTVPYGIDEVMSSPLYTSPANEPYVRTPLREHPFLPRVESGDPRVFQVPRPGRVARNPSSPLFYNGNMNIAQPKPKIVQPREKIASKLRSTPKSSLSRWNKSFYSNV